MKFKQDILITKKNYILLKIFGFYKNEKPVLEGPEVVQDNKDLASKSWDTRNHAKDILLKSIFQVELFVKEVVIISKRNLAV